MFYEKLILNNVLRRNKPILNVIDLFVDNNNNVRVDSKEKEIRNHHTHVKSPHTCYQASCPVFNQYICVGLA